MHNYATERCWSKCTTNAESDTMKEIDKWSNCHHDVNVIEDFLTWCQHRKERVILASQLKDSERYVPYWKSMRQLLEEYFKINTYKLEMERRALLKDCYDKSKPKEL